MVRVKIYIFLIIILIFCVSFTNASQNSIKISPLKTILKIKIGAENCTIIYFLPDKNTTLDNKWSNEKLSDNMTYTLSKEDVKIKINYIRLEYGKYKICFKGDKPGYFYGKIFFQPQDSLIKMGTWVELDIESENVFEKISLVTGNVIASNREYRFDLILVVILLIILLFLVLRNFLKTIKAPYKLISQ
jgi:hypothetical protein